MSLNSHIIKNSHISSIIEMQIGRIVLPQLERKSRSSVTNIRKGLAISQVVQSSHPVLFQQIISKLQVIKAKYPQIQDFLKSLKPLLEKIKNHQNKEKEIIQLTQQNSRAQQKINQLKYKLKKTQIKYNKDISELIKLKILSESSSISKNKLLFQCNHTQITNKIMNLIQKSDTTSVLTSRKHQNRIKTQQPPKNNEKHTQKTTGSVIKIIDLLPSQQKDNITMSQSKQINLLTRHMSQVCPTSFEKLQRQQILLSKQLKQKLQLITQQHRQLNQVLQSYKQQCIDRQNQQIIMARILLQKDVQ